MTAQMLAVLALLQFDSVPKPRPLLAVGEALAINLFVNRVDAWVFKDDWAQTGPKYWSRNLRLGWEWDEDAFPTNMFAHPYHGGLYFNAGRSNGLGYFESVPIAFMGSWTWEYLGETYRPSLNDWFMTSFGGISWARCFIASAQRFATTAPGASAERCASLRRCRWTRSGDSTG